MRKKVVDARYLESSIPATHTPSFTVDDGARCVPVNALVKEAEPAGGYVVLGAGKTAMDACVWLLEQGVDPDRITWVKPREPWLIDRKNLQPRELVGDFIKDWAASVEAAAHATSVPDLFERLESCGALVRVDKRVEPTMFRAPILSEYERDLLGTIEHVVRNGHVQRIQPDRMVMDGGDVDRPGRRPVRRLHRRGPAVTAASTDLRGRADHAAGHPGGQPVVQRRAHRLPRGDPGRRPRRPPTS